MTTAAVVAYYTQEKEARVSYAGTPLSYTSARAKMPGPMQDRQTGKIKVMVFRETFPLLLIWVHASNNLRFL